MDVGKGANQGYGFVVKTRCLRTTRTGHHWGVLGRKRDGKLSRNDRCHASGRPIETMDSDDQDVEVGHVLPGFQIRLAV